MPQTSETPASPTARWPLAVALLALAALLAYGFWSYSYDDAFITYRYASNFAEVGRLEYNPGELVLGTTAPGWGLLLGGLSWVSGLAVAGWGTVLSLLALALLTLTLASALRGAAPLFRLGLPLVFGGLALTLRWNLEMFGAETMAVTVLVPLGVLVALRGRGATGGALLAAAALCRLDAALAFVLLLPVLALRERPTALRLAVAFGIPVALFLGGLELHFGSIVPNTLGAKQSELSAELPGYGRLQWPWLRRSLPAPGGAFGVIALAVVAVGVGIHRMIRTRGGGGAAQPEVVAAGVLGAWLVVHEVAYRALAVPFAPWYHVPAVNALVALAATGALIVGTGLARPVPAHLRSVAAFALGTALLLAVFHPWAFVRDSWRRPPDPRYAACREIGEHLAREAPPGATVAALEVGVIGAFAPQLRVLDLGGLVSPEVLIARHDGRLAELVAQRRPEYLVHSTLFPDLFDALLAEPQIAKSYHEVLRIPDGRGEELRLLRRGVAL